RNVSAPGSRLSASKIITGGRQLIETLDLRRTIRTFQFHTHDRACWPGFQFSCFVVTNLEVLFSFSVCGRIIERHHCLSRSKEKHVAFATRQKFDSLMGLSLIELEIEWQRVSNCDQLLLRSAVVNRWLRSPGN